MLRRPVKRQRLVLDLMARRRSSGATALATVTRGVISLRNVKN